jgi:hypothetical protein
MLNANYRDGNSPTVFGEMARPEGQGLILGVSHEHPGEAVRPQTEGAAVFPVVKSAPVTKATLPATLTDRSLCGVGSHNMMPGIVRLDGERRLHRI